MFYLIGLGLKPEHLTIEAKEALQRCTKIFFEGYTSRYSEGSIAFVEAIAGKKFVELSRSGVEEGFGLILKEAKEQDIALLVFGNPLNATTHIQLLLDAKKLGVKAKAIAGLSVFDFLANTGLDPYKFGRVCTIVSPTKNFAPESFFETIEKNFKAGLHTLCLLDTCDGKDFLSVSDALAILERIEKKRGRSLLKKAVLVGLYGIGSKFEKIKAASLDELKRSGYKGFPQSLVVAGQLNEKEREALHLLAGWHG